MSDLVQDKLDIEALKSRAKDNLYFFTKGILGYDWLNKHIHLPVCGFLQDSRNTSKLIELPRGWLKSTICSISYPVWLSARNPNIRQLLVQNSATNAQKKLSVISRQWETNPLLRALFPELLPTTDSTWTADSICLNRSASHAESTYEAAGTSTRVVSRHYDVIIEDDTVAPDYDELGADSLAPTHDDVQKAIGWHKANVLPLMNNPSTDTSVVVGTRWYDQDLIAWIKDNEKHYQVYSRAARENDRGEPDPAGRIVYPERFNEETLRKLENALGPYLFSALYLNRPVRTEDMTFKLEWMQNYENAPLNLVTYTTVDPATDPELASSRNIDYNVVLTAGKDITTGNIYILDYFHARCNPGELAAAIFDHAVRFRPVVVGYDNTGYQRSIAYWLKELMRQNNHYFVMEPIPRSGKDAKANAIRNLQPLFQNKVVFLRPHMRELQSQLLKWPHSGGHDDLADALAMQLQLWKRTKVQSRYTVPVFQNSNTLDDAMKELRERGMLGTYLKSLVYEPMRTGVNSGIQGIYS